VGLGANLTRISLSKIVNLHGYILPRFQGFYYGAQIFRERRCELQIFAGGWMAEPQQMGMEELSAQETTLTAINGVTGQGMAH
jgi:hypothetical protein